MPRHSFILNSEPVEVEIDDDVRLLWVLRDVLGVTGPKYGCGLGVCRACTSHLNGEAFTPCTVGADLHPVQQAWLEHDVAQCGYCQPGQIMAVAALIATGGRITEADVDELRNICRCGTYPRIRLAIRSLEPRTAGG